MPHPLAISNQYIPSPSHIQPICPIPWPYPTNISHPLAISNQYAPSPGHIQPICPIPWPYQPIFNQFLICVPSVSHLCSVSAPSMSPSISNQHPICIPFTSPSTGHPPLHLHPTLHPTLQPHLCARTSAVCSSVQYTRTFEMMQRSSRGQPDLRIASTPECTSH